MAATLQSVTRIEPMWRIGSPNSSRLAQLLEARPVVRTLTLREQVAHELDVSESTARLDVYTNGYFSRVLEGS